MHHALFLSWTAFSQSIALFAEITVSMRTYFGTFQKWIQKCNGEKKLIFMIDLFIFLKVVFDNNKGNSFSDMWQKLTIVWSS